MSYRSTITSILLFSSTLSTSVAARADTPSLPSAPTEIRSTATAAPTAVSNQVGVHLLSLFVNRINIEYERRMAPQYSLLVAPKIGIGKLSSWGSGDIFGDSIGVELGARFFVSGAALSGFFMQPTLSYDHFFASKGHADRLGVHGKVGYQWVIAQRAFFNLSGGAAYNAQWSSADASSAWLSSAEDSRGFLPDASFSIGVGF